MNHLSSEQMERLAHRRAGAKLGWYVHAALFVVVSLFFFGISSYAFGDHRLPALPLMTWGVALGLHGISVFLLGPGAGLQQRLLRRERDRLRRQQSL